MLVTTPPRCRPLRLWQSHTDLTATPTCRFLTVVTLRIWQLFSTRRGIEAHPRGIQRSPPAADARIRGKL